MKLRTDFTLKTVDGNDTIQLSKLIGPKPVVLIFGNFTCGPFRSFYPDVELVYQRFKGKAHFVMVYVREAHPTDGWKMESNAKVGIAVKQPIELGERVKVCDQFCKKLKPTMPVVVDEINDKVGNSYSGMPARMYVIDPKGKVAYKTGRGPFGFKVGEMEQALVMCLLESVGKNKEPKFEKKPTSRLPSLSNNDAWKLLPRAEPALPAWARTLIDSLPKTTALMLKLDYVHRVKNPLGQLLYGKLRWVAADAIGCAYSRRYAEADLRRAGITEVELKRLMTGQWNDMPASSVRHCNSPAS